jgi:hypothetical protein
MIHEVILMLQEAGPVGITFDDIIKKLNVNKTQAFSSLKRIRDSPKLYFGPHYTIGERYLTIYKRGLSYSIKVFYLEKKRTI